MKLGCKWIRRDLAVFAAKISDLACCRRSGVAGRILAADEGVEAIIVQGLGIITHYKRDDHM